MNQIVDKVKFWVQQNKKMSILIGIVVVVLLLVLIFSGKGGGTEENALTLLEEIHAQSYTADGTVVISDKSLQLNINKAENTFFVNVTNGDTEYTDLLAKSGNVLYLNDGLVEDQGGLLTLNCVENEEAKAVFDVLYEAIAGCTNITYEIEDDAQIMTIDTTEGWAEFWGAINSGIEANLDAIAAGYSQPDVIKTQLKTFMTDIKKIAETETIANTLTAKVATAEGSYTLSFDVTMDMSMLPSFAKAEDIDSNKLKISGEIAFAVTDSSAISRKPVGAIHAATPVTIDSFMSSLWNAVFEKGTYVSFNQISVTNDSLSLTRKLGETTETLQLVFSTEGVTNAVWYITSPNEGLIDSYVNKYQGSSNKDLFLKVLMDDNTYSLTVTVSESGIDSFNKIAKTPKAMSEYLNSAKGGDIIV